VVHIPALGLKQSRHPAITVAAIIAGKAEHRLSQGILIVTVNLLTALHRAVLSQNPAGKPFGYAKTLLDMDDALAAAFGA
jgi:hypothetical protein